MRSPLYKKFLASAGNVLTSTVLTGAALSANATAETSIKLNEPRTVVAPGKNPEELNGGKVAFVVDATKIGNMDYLFSKRIAIIFDGQASPDRQCPYISTDNREPVYKTLKNRVFRVETPATAKEIETVKAKGCLITDSPPISSVLGSGPN